jgi:hypothetical protein
MKAELPLYIAGVFVAIAVAVAVYTHGLEYLEAVLLFRKLFHACHTYHDHGRLMAELANVEAG